VKNQQRERKKRTSHFCRDKQRTGTEICVVEIEIGFNPLRDQENQWRLRQMNPPVRLLAAKNLDLAKPAQKEKANLSTPPGGLLETGSGIRNQQRQNSQHTQDVNCDFFVEIKTQLEPIHEVTILPPSFDYWNRNLVHDTLLI
jgi:hypothetical protein